MDATALRALQAPLKDTYRANPDAAVITLKAKGTLDDTKIACKVETGRAIAEAGLHPATGGSGMELCSGECCWEALVAFAGVTLEGGGDRAGDPAALRYGQRRGRSRFPRHARRRQEAPVGFRNIRLFFQLDTDASEEKLAQLLKLTERYCVVFQTLNHKPELSVAATTA